MKKCGNCGRENEDAASQCSGCGSVLAPPELKARKGSLFPRDHLLIHGLIAILVALVIFGISLKTAWRQSSHSIGWNEQRLTEHVLRNIGDAVIAYQQASNACPESFEQLEQFGLHSPAFKDAFEYSNYSVDGWKRPFIFSKEGTNCIAISYGRDGKPGGVGIDCDLTTLRPLPKESMPTFEQFWTNERMREVIVWCFICGVMAGFLSLITVRIPDLSPRGLGLLALTLLVTIIGTFFVASIITILHVPSGH